MIHRTMTPLQTKKICSLNVLLEDGNIRPLSAASALVKLGGRFYVIADDELSLAKFSFEPEIPGSLTSLFEGELPQDRKERKKLKPDLESLLLIPKEFWPPHGALLAIPSGSKPQRQSGALCAFSLLPEFLESPRKIDFKDLFAELEKSLPDLNIEGAVATHEHLKLFQRGNGRSGKNAVINLNLSRTLFSLREKNAVLSDSIESIAPCDLRGENGLNYSFTDAACDSQERIWFLAVAESGLSTYEDGVYQGALLGCLNAKDEVVFKVELECPMKPEGLAVDSSSGKFYVVTDADDPGTASELFIGEMPSNV